MVELMSAVSPIVYEPDAVKRTCIGAALCAESTGCASRFDHGRDPVDQATAKVMRTSTRYRRRAFVPSSPPISGLTGTLRLHQCPSGVQREDDVD